MPLSDKKCQSQLRGRAAPCFLIAHKKWQKDIFESTKKDQYVE